MSQIGSVLTGTLKNPHILNWLSKNRDVCEIELKFTSENNFQTYSHPPELFQSFIHEPDVKYVLENNNGKPLSELSVENSFLESTVNRCKEKKKMKISKSVKEEIESIDGQCSITTSDNSGDMKLASKKLKVKQTHLTPKIKYETIIAHERSITKSNNAQILQPTKHEAFVCPRDIGSRTVTNTKLNSNPKQTVTSLIDSTHLLSLSSTLRNDALWKQYKTEGYLYFKQLLPRNEVIEAKEYLSQSLVEFGYVDSITGKCSNEIKKGWTVDCTNGATIVGSNSHSSDEVNLKVTRKWNEICHHDSLLALRKSEVIRDILTMMGKGKSNEYYKCTSQHIPTLPHVFNNYSWLRVKAQGEMTPEHADIFYMRDQAMFTGSIGTPIPKTDFQETDKYLSLNYQFHAKHAHLCSVCNESNTECETLRCDECLKYTHTNCVKYSIYEREYVDHATKSKSVWYCHECDFQHTIGTCWIPLGDVPVESGVLAILPKSMDLIRFYQRLNKMNAQINQSYHIQSNNTEGKVWHTGSYNAGDVVIFDSHVIHATSKNYTDSFRLSLDFRWDLVPQRPNVWQTVRGKFVHKNSRCVANDQSEVAPRKHAEVSSSSNAKGKSVVQNMRKESGDIAPRKQLLLREEVAAIDSSRGKAISSKQTVKTTTSAVVQSTTSTTALSINKNDKKRKLDSMTDTYVCSTKPPSNSKTEPTTLVPQSETKRKLTSDIANQISRKLKPSNSSSVDNSGGLTMSNINSSKMTSESSVSIGNKLIIPKSGNVTVTSSQRSNSSEGSNKHNERDTTTGRFLPASSRDSEQKSHTSQHHHSTTPMGDISRSSTQQQKESELDMHGKVNIGDRQKITHSGISRTTEEKRVENSSNVTLNSVSARIALSSSVQVSMAVLPTNSSSAVSRERVLETSSSSSNMNISDSKHQTRDTVISIKSSASSSNNMNTSAKTQTVPQSSQSTVKKTPIRQEIIDLCSSSSSDSNSDDEDGDNDEPTQVATKSQSHNSATHSATHNTTSAQVNNTSSASNGVKKFVLLQSRLKSSYNYPSTCTSSSSMQGNGITTSATQPITAVSSSSNSSSSNSSGVNRQTQSNTQSNNSNPAKNINTSSNTNRNNHSSSTNTPIAQRRSSSVVSISSDDEVQFIPTHNYHQIINPLPPHSSSNSSSDDSDENSDSSDSNSNLNLNSSAHFFMNSDGEMEEYEMA